MAHPRTKLTVFGLQLLIARVEVLGWPAAHAAAMQGISRATVDPRGRSRPATLRTRASACAAFSASRRSRPRSARRGP
jgi:hypothetical protein